MKGVALAPQSFTAPRKLFYRIHEVAKMTGLKPYVLRYWETEFKELAPAKDASDQRRYRQSDIEVILAIRKLLYEERYTIKGARPRLREELKNLRAQGRGESATAMVVTMPAGPPMSASQSVAAATHRRPVADKTSAPRLDRNLNRLRMEVNELIAMLGA